MFSMTTDGYSYCITQFHVYTSSIDAGLEIERERMANWKQDKQVHPPKRL
jgi:hypothetical protein